MHPTRWSPFETFDNFFKRNSPSFLGENTLSTDWQPSVDITENESEFLIKAELPGVPKEDIKVQVENGILTLSGERKSEKVDEKNHRTERFYGSFSRSFTLPENVNKDTIQAENENGMLNLHLPKFEVKSDSKVNIEVN